MKEEGSEMAVCSVQDKGTSEEKQSACLNCRQLIASDLRAWSKIWSSDNTAPERIGLWQGVRLMWEHCGLRATVLYRLSHALWKNRVPLLPGMVKRLNIVLYGFDIPQSVEIGPGLYMPHPVGTSIMAKRIGANVSLISSITIGMRNVHAFPTIGNNVFIGAGARVLGDIVVGDNSNIGANAVVLKDVPPGSTAVGVPARILPIKNTA